MQLETASTEVSVSPNALLPLREIARLDRSGRHGKAAHISKYLRLIKNGAALRDGSRIRLRAVRDSGGWLTSLDWLAEFRGRLTADCLGKDAEDVLPRCALASTPVPAPGPIRRTARERQAAAERAGRILESLGC